MVFIKFRVAVKIYRVAKKKFVRDLSGEGARLYGGRWNRKGSSMLYFSEHLSLCVLELLTRIDYEFLSEDYSFIEVEISEKSIDSISQMKPISTTGVGIRRFPPPRLRIGVVDQKRTSGTVRSFCGIANRVKYLD